MNNLKSTDTSNNKTSNHIKLGSLFDGSGGFPLAASMCGIEPVWASEIEPYPIAVTRSRFPGMKHMGDISKINGAEIEPVDIITFGSPCQDLSVAGKRAGLKHEANGDDETTRSGLFMEAVRIIKEMREATNGEYPTFAVWENVPGAFSSNSGEDFRTVLEELIKIVEPKAVMPAVPPSGWAYADSYVGNGWSLAYRVFDAQYWGVPQRRRRIHLVVDFRGERAGEVLFEREGMRGYFATGRTPWQRAAGDAADCAGADDCEGEGNCLTPWDVQSRRIFSVDGPWPALYGGEGGGHGYACIPCTLKIRSGCEGGGKGAIADDCEGECVAYSFDSLASNSMKSKNPHSGCRRVEIAKTLDTTDPNPSKNQGGIAIVCIKECLPFDTTQVTSPQNGCNPKWGDPCHPLAAQGHPPTVICKCYDARENGDGQTVSTLTGDHENRITDYTSVVCEPAVAFKTYQKVTGPLMANSHPGSYTGQDAFSDMLVAGVDCRNGTEYPEMNGTLQAKSNGGFSYNCNQVVRVQYIVRRLTPTECARLQGFPDDWGHPDHKEDFTDEEYRFWLNVRNTHAAINGKVVKEYTEHQMLTWYNKLHTDSAEYKMWGNGIALPPALYCMQGIADALNI